MIVSKVVRAATKRGNRIVASDDADLGIKLIAMAKLHVFEPRSHKLILMQLRHTLASI